MVSLAKKLLCFLLFFTVFQGTLECQEYRSNKKKSDQIKADTSYYWGVSDIMSDIDEAEDAAVEGLLRNIEKTYKSNCVLFSGDQSGQLKTIFNTFSGFVSQRAEILTLFEGDDNQCFAYITREDFRKSCNERTDEISHYVGRAKDAMESENMGDALRFYYISLLLCYSHPNGKDMVYTTDDGDVVNLVKWLSDQISGNDGILHQLNFIVKEWNVVDNQSEIVLVVNSKSGWSVSNLNIRYYDGCSRSEAVVENGKAVLHITGEADDDVETADIEVNLEYDDLERESPAAFAMMKQLKRKLKFDGTEYQVRKPSQRQKDRQEKKENKPENVMKNDPVVANVAEAPSTADIHDASNDNGDMSVSDEEKSFYGARMKNIENAIIQSDISSVEQLFTPEGFEMFTQLMNYGRVSVIGSPEYKFLRFNGEVIVRCIPMQFWFSRKSFSRDVVLRFDEETKLVSSLALRLSETAENDICKNTRWKAESRMVLVTFLEDYQTAYALKRIDYLNDIFSDDALIIIGHVLQPQKNLKDRMELRVDNSTIEYIQKSKEEYIRDLGSSFRSKEYINVHFTDLQVEKGSDNNNEVYGIQVRQYYYSSNYSDNGYLFLMVDLRNNLPIIHVRTWQPEQTDINSLITIRSVF